MVTHFCRCAPPAPPRLKASLHLGCQRCPRQNFSQLFGPSPGQMNVRRVSSGWNHAIVVDVVKLGPRGACARACASAEACACGCARACACACASALLVMSGRACRRSCVHSCVRAGASVCVLAFVRACMPSCFRALARAIVRSFGFCRCSCVLSCVLALLQRIGDLTWNNLWV